MAATTLWTRDFTLVTVASALGAIGSIAGGFALSFMVFDETGSTLASALVIAIQLVPYFVVPIAAAPWMDRLPRKPFLVAGDCVNAVLYALAGLYLMHCSFSYVGYLVFSLIISSLGAFDELAYNSMYPKLIPQGMEQRGYTVSSMLYPVMNVVMMPVAGVLYETVGVGWVLVAQGCLSAAAAAIESRIRVHEERRMDGERASLALWWADVREAARYLRGERGLASMYVYQAVTNGVASGYAPLLVAHSPPRSASLPRSTRSSRWPSFSGAAWAASSSIASASPTSASSASALASTTSTSSWTWSCCGCRTRSCWPTERWWASAASTAPRCGRRRCRPTSQTSCAPA